MGVDNQPDEKEGEAADLSPGEMVKSAGTKCRLSRRRTSQERQADWQTFLSVPSELREAYLEAISRELVSEQDKRRIKHEVEARLMIDDARDYPSRRETLIQVFAHIQDNESDMSAFIQQGLVSGSEEEDFPSVSDAHYETRDVSSQVSIPNVDCRQATASEAASIERKIEAGMLGVPSAYTPSLGSRARREAQIHQEQLERASLSSLSDGNSQLKTMSSRTSVIMEAQRKIARQTAKLGQKESRLSRKEKRIAEKEIEADENLRESRRTLARLNRQAQDLENSQAREKARGASPQRSEDSFRHYSRKSPPSKTSLHKIFASQKYAESFGAESLDELKDEIKHDVKQMVKSEAKKAFSNLNLSADERDVKHKVEQDELARRMTSLEQRHDHMSNLTIANNTATIHTTDAMMKLSASQQQMTSKLSDLEQRLSSHGSQSDDTLTQRSPLDNVQGGEVPGQGGGSEALYTQTPPDPKGKPAVCPESFAQGLDKQEALGSPDVTPTDPARRDKPEFSSPPPDLQPWSMEQALALKADLYAIADQEYEKRILERGVKYRKDPEGFEFEPTEPQTYPTELTIQTITSTLPPRRDPSSSWQSLVQATGAGLHQRTAGSQGGRRL